MKKDFPPSLLNRRGFIRQAACAAVGTAALTNILEDLRLINCATAQTGVTSDYKALVCVFLNGGNDANNLFIPTDPSPYNDYAVLRTPVLAIPNADGTGATALQLTPKASDGRSIGLHPACPELNRLFTEQKAAALFNVGSLVYPMTRAQYNSNSVTKPPQLFSHSDQQTQWQTSIPDRPPTSGWGGRCADLLNSTANAGGQISFAVSLAGTNTWERGGVLQQYSVNTSGAVALTSLNAAQKAAMRNVMLGAQTNLQAQAYGASVLHAIDEADVVNTAIAANANTFVAPSNDPVLTSGTALFPTTVTTPNGGSTFTSSLSSQLKMVARLIDAGSRAAASGGLGMKRQIFFVQVGGYDTHTNQTAVGGAPTAANVIIGSQANLFAELSRCLYGFQRAMELLGLGPKVTSFTASDFGRTFPSNGQGSDHGWGSHHIIVGGGVDGSKTYGRFPVHVVNGPDDTSTGRWIPSTSIDQYSATLASWFGVDQSNLSTIFPNLGRFSTAPAFMKST